MEDFDKANEAPSAAASTPAAPAKPDLKNSHWCMHSVHGLGQIGEIGAQVSFHKATADGVESTPVMVELRDLALCTPEQLPARLGYTEQQLKDLGYAR